MEFRVFVSHSVGPEENALPWRLQTLAAAHGIKVYVARPPKPQYQIGQSGFDHAKKEVRREIKRSDCVLALITNLSQTSRRALEEELNTAIELQKPIIPIIEKGLVNDALARSLSGKGVPLFVLSSDGNGGQVEKEVAQFLEKRNLSKEIRQAVSGLVALAVGLLLLSAVSSE